MRLTICAVGRLRAGPEKALIDDYLSRAGRSGRALGIGPVQVAEVDERKVRGKAAEAAQLHRTVPQNARICALDERGKILTSVDFSRTLGKWRDAGAADAAFLIGGADGLDPSLRNEADLVLSFGPMVWPHMLARVMLAEQIYRATQILSGTPYHRV